MSLSLCWRLQNRPPPCLDVTMRLVWESIYTHELTSCSGVSDAELYSIEVCVKSVALTVKFPSISLILVDTTRGFEDSSTLL